MKLVLIAIMSLFLAACFTTGGPSPSYYAYADAMKRLEKNVSTYEQVKEIYGECNNKEEIDGGYRCIWKNSNTVVRSTENFATNAPANFDPGRSIGRYTYTTVYTSTLTAVFSKDNILKSFSVSNNIEQ
ncbi:MAG: hypothetical protein J5746_05860 [Victivallales bacterium]|nr:hypothetical protein [Victivallales bacterium]